MIGLGRRGMGLAAVALIAVAGVYGLLRWRAAQEAIPRFQTQEVGRGDIVRTVTANGTLNPVVLVNVGTQISGTILKLYVDFNQRVRAGEVLAELDPALILAQVRVQESGLQNAQATLKLARLKEQRSRVLVERKFVTESQLEEAVQAREAAEAQVASSSAQLERERANLRYTVIRSPVSGVVVSRSVDLGQTVAASFQTPTLFQIAQDLRQMQIDTSVAEADIGGIVVGSPVRFNVDAYPERQFQGQVRQIRLNPTIQQNVVTYNVVVAVDNAESLLIPGMTAHARFNAGSRRDALRIPNTALRYRPARKDVARPRPPNGAIVYRLAGDRPEGVAVKTGLSDAQYTEVLEGPLRIGDRLIVEETGPKGEKPGGRFGLRLF